VGALKKPPGRERATDIEIHLVDTVRSTPRWNLGRSVVLVAEKEVSPGVRANRDCAPKSNIAAGLLSIQATWAVHLGEFHQGYWWNIETTRPIDSALHDIFDLF
jgi:hypothetical protein